MALRTSLDAGAPALLRVNMALGATLPAMASMSDATDPWDGLFAWGDQFQKATGITPADIDEAVRRVRSCKL